MRLHTILLTQRNLIAVLVVGLLFLTGCTEEVETINIGYIGPLSKRATDLGLAPSNALKLSVKEYNAKRQGDEPKVVLHIEDDQWEKDRAIPAYEKLRREHNIKIVFISNTDGTTALSDKVLEDKVILVNPLNNDALLSALNHNTFKIAKSTEEANSIIALRIIELGLKKVALMHYPNDFMTRATASCKKIFDANGIECTVRTMTKDQLNFEAELTDFKNSGADAYVFFGYKNFGFGMKQARELNIKAPFFGSTVLLEPEFYENSAGTIVGTECSFFTPVDGNYVLAREFLDNYEATYGSQPFSVWPPMQAYDAMNLVLTEIKTMNTTKTKEEPFDDWLRSSLLNVKYYNGICGNISIDKNGASKGIYFSLYSYESKGKLNRIKR